MVAPGSAVHQDFDALANCEEIDNLNGGDSAHAVAISSGRRELADQCLDILAAPASYAGKFIECSLGIREFWNGFTPEIENT